MYVFDLIILYCDRYVEKILNNIDKYLIYNYKLF